MQTSLIRSRLLLLLPPCFLLTACGPDAADTSDTGDSNISAEPMMLEAIKPAPLQLDLKKPLLSSPNTRKKSLLLRPIPQPLPIPPSALTQMPAGPIPPQYV